MLKLILKDGRLITGKDSVFTENYKLEEYKVGIVERVF